MLCPISTAVISICIENFFFQFRSHFTLILSVLTDFNCVLCIVHCMEPALLRGLDFMDFFRKVFFFPARLDSIKACFNGLVGLCEVSSQRLGFQWSVFALLTVPILWNWFVTVMISGQPLGSLWSFHAMLLYRHSEAVNQWDQREDPAAFLQKRLPCCSCCHKLELLNSLQRPLCLVRLLSLLHSLDMCSAFYVFLFSWGSQLCVVCCLTIRNSCFI